MTRTARALLLAAGAAVLAMLVVRTGPATIAALLRGVGWGFVVVSALYATHLAVRAGALWRSLPTPTLRYRDVLAVRLAGEAVEMLTFTGPFLAEPAKGFLLKRRGLDSADAYGAVAIEYLLYTLTSAWIAAGALSTLSSRHLIPGVLRGPIIGIVVGIGVFTAGCALTAMTGIGLIAPIVRVLGRLVGGASVTAIARLEAIERVLVDFMHRRPARLAEVVLTELAAHGLLAAEVWVVLRSLGLPVALSDPLLVEGGVKFISVAFFFVPGQLGASEGVYSWLVRTLGFSAAAGLTLALVRRVRALIVAALGLAVLAMMKRRDASSPESPERTARR